MEPPDDFLPTRNSLLTRLKDWDDSVGWKRFFDTYWRLIYGAAVKSGLSDAEAQDVVQETVISVAKKMQEFKYDPAVGSFKGWLLTLTRWRIVDQIRKRGHLAQSGGAGAGNDPGTSQLESVPDERGLKLEAIWEAEWHENLLQAALQRVKRKAGARQYQLFDLHVIKEWPVEDVVKTLGVSGASVYQAKSRVSALLRKEVTTLEKELF